MIHRHIHNILTSGIGVIKADSTILDDLFCDNYSLTKVELASVKTYFMNKGLNVINGYPRSDSIYPLVAIILSEDSEVETFLNDEAAPIFEEDSPYFHMDLKSSIWEYTYQLLVLTEHPDITAYYYEIIKSILLLGYELLVDLGCYDFNLSGGELAPDPRYIPEQFFARQLTFRLRAEFQRYDKDSKYKKAFKIEGIHIDKTASNYDTGDVETNVKPYLEE